MPKPAAKVAISIPAALHKAVEGARRRARKTRSAVVQEALRDWLRREAEAELVREYEAGYRARPEDASEIEATLATSAALLRDAEDW
jgi:metal-responsive CopG/Arc/MetJ family transcriptional regulator